MYDITTTSSKVHQLFTGGDFGLGKGVEACGVFEFVMPACKLIMISMKQRTHRS